MRRIKSGKSFKLIDFAHYDERMVLPDESIYDDITIHENNHIENNQNNQNNQNEEYSPPPPLRFVIQMFGINEIGETCCIFIKDYKPFFYVKVSQNWTSYNVTILFQEIRNKLEKYHQKYLISAELVEHNKLYGFSGGQKFKFVKLTFANMMTFNRVKNLWYYQPAYNANARQPRERKLKPLISQNIILELYESKIPPLLRYFHIYNISPSGWVFIPTNKMVEPLELTTTCKYEYICNCKDLEPQPKKETITPYKICSFDIEASSSHGDFPVPIKTYKRLATNLIDLYIKKTAFKPLKNEMLDTFIKMCIMVAFGFGFENTLKEIDVVYPKNPPSSKSELSQLIENVIHTPLDQENHIILSDNEVTPSPPDAEQTNSKSTLSNNERKKKLLSIETLFDKIRENANTNVTDGGDGGGGGEEDCEECPDNSDEIVEIDDIENENAPAMPPLPTSTPVQKPTRAKKMSIVPSKTIKDVITDNSLTRDNKIQILNEVMVYCLPELEGDKVTFIGSTFVKYGEKEPYLNHCLVLNTCAEVPNAVIETVNTEYEILLKWSELIQRENPDIIIGYNIFGFDYEFMLRRSQENGCERQFLTLSKKLGEISGNFNRSKMEYELDNTKIVLSTGEYDLKYPRMAGRVQIDLYTYFRRDFNLSSYKLDDVAGEFIGDVVTKVELKDPPIHQTWLYTENVMGLHVGDYIHIELSEFTTDYFKEGMKFRVAEILNIPAQNGDPSTPNDKVIVIDGIEEDLKRNKKNVKWCMAKDDVTPQDIFRLTNGSAEDRAIVAKYCIQDCNLVHHLFNKMDIMTGYIEMSRICSVPISYLILRGQGIKLTSFVAKKCRDKNTLMPDIEKKGTDEGYEGAIVLPPKCDMYMDNPVACVDYSSLYPSSMISQNYSHDSKVWTKEYNLEGVLVREIGEKDHSGRFIYDGLAGYEYIDVEFDTFEWRKKPNSKTAVKTKVGRKMCRWAQLPNDQKSIMPSILEELLKARKETRKLIKTEKDSFMQNILDKRQLGYKVTANSLYGQCGSKTSTFYEQDVAASTTATGRMMITYAKRIIEEVYGDMVYATKTHGEVQCNAEYVYGDTDSVFFTFNLKDPLKNNEPIIGKKALEITIEIAQDVANLCTQFLKPPMELSYEKTLWPFCLLSKKRYFGKLFEYNPNKGKLKFMGLSLKRRDNCDLLKDVYGQMLNILLIEDLNLTQKMERCMEYLDNCLQGLIKGNVSMEKLAITKSLSGYYKNPDQIAHAVLAERIGNREVGNKPKPGDRIKYIHIFSRNSKALQGEKIETPEFIRTNGVEIDYSFYITNQLMKPLQQLFGLAVKEILSLKSNMHSINIYRNDIETLKRECGDDLETYAKRKEKYCSGVVKNIVFEKYLIQIKNKREGICQIDKYFATTTVPGGNHPTTPFRKKY